MPLADYKPPRRKIEFDGGSFEVRAISLQDVAMIVDAHEQTIVAIVTKVQTRKDLDFESPEIIADTIMEVIRESPLLAANVIAICADEPAQMAIAMSLPMPVQVETLQAIAGLTFTDMAAIKKFAADVIRLIRGILPPPTVAPADASGGVGR